MSRENFLNITVEISLNHQTKKILLKMKILIVFASFINAGEIMMTCDQAREFCVGGIYIEPSRICTTYPDQIDPRDQTCLSDAPWLCNQLAHFRTNQHTPAKCSSPTHSVGAIGAKLKTVRHWDQDQKSGKKIVPYYFKPNDHSESDQQQIRAAFKVELQKIIDKIIRFAQSLVNFSIEKKITQYHDIFQENLKFNQVNLSNFAISGIAKLLCLVLNQSHYQFKLQIKITKLTHYQ